MWTQSRPNNNEIRFAIYAYDDKAVACFLLQPRLERVGAPTKMSRLSILLLALMSIVGLSEISRAQEAVSTTSGTGTGGSTSAPSSATSTTELSTGTTSSPGAVTNAPSATSSSPSGSSGVGVFSPTPVQFYASIFGGYDDNVGTRGGPKQGSAFSGGNIVLDYTFGDPRLQIILNLGAGGSYYFDRPSPAAPGPSPSPVPSTTQDYDVDFKAAFGITYKSSPRLTLGATVLLDYLTEPNFDNPGGLNSRSGNYFYTTDEFFVTYAWSRRFNTKTSYTLETYQYDDSTVGSFSNRVSNTFGNEFRLQMVPTTMLVAEYRYGIVTYENSSLDSTTQYALGGIDHTFNPRFSGSIRGGAEFRSYDNDGDRTGPYFEGSLNYAVGKRTTVSWNARYGLEEPEVPGAQSRTTFRTGLHGKFDLTSRISSSIDAFYTHDEYHALATALNPIAPFSEDTFDIGLNLHYAITPLIGVQAGYHYTDITSGVAGREYSRNRVSGGVSLKF
jgi:hypothetical protein